MHLSEDRRFGPGSGILLACIAFGLFAAGDATAKYLSRDYAVLQLLFLGSAFAVIPILLFIARTGGLASMRPNRPALCLARGVLTAVSVLMIVWSFTRLPLADGYTLAFTAPLIVAALSGWLLGERVTSEQWVVIGVGFLGVLIMLQPGFVILDVGHASALGSAAIFALSLIILRSIGDGETPGALLITYLLATLIVYGPFIGFVWLTPATWTDWVLIAGIGLASGLGQIALVFAFRAAPAALVAPCQYTQLLWGVVFGALIFGEPPKLAMLLGAVLVVGSGWFLGRRTASP